MPSVCSGTDEDEDKGDKKTVKQIIAQLLSNNHQSNQVRKLHSVIISLLTPPLDSTRLI